MFKFCSKPTIPDLLSSKLYDETTFYAKFERDLRRCGSEVIIESPFITSKRLDCLLPTLEKLHTRHVRIVINTRDPEDHSNEHMCSESRYSIAKLQHLGIHVFYTEGHHRKLAILDRKILYEGSLNILSQNNSSEIMRRIESVQLAWQMIKFVKIDQVVR
jgi:phosphatidylserine/phosphatidylglycerophosphate/cardiolipin synthase-like enzyme